MPNRKNVCPLTAEQHDKLDEIKRSLCIAIKNQVKARKKVSPNDIAQLMGTNRARLSDVETLKLDQLTLSQLFHYLVRLNANFKLQLLFQYYETKPKYQDEVLTAARMAILKGQLIVPHLSDEPDS